MQLSFESQSQNSDTMASDRLRKAIERNRAKQAKRGTSAPPRPKMSAPPRPSSSRSFGQTSTASPSSSSTATTRRSVAKVNDVEFTRDLVANSQKPVANVGYTKAKRKVSTKKRTSKKAKSDSAYIDYFVKACWVFAAVLMGRLVFSSGGVVDYYQSVSKLDEKVYEFKSIQAENKVLSNEITLIKEDSSYQKKIVRDHLGYIAKDEYLILFHQENRFHSSM